MKKCPYCAEMIQDEAVKCRYCGSMLVAAPEEQEKLLLRINPSFKPILGVYVAAFIPIIVAVVVSYIFQLPTTWLPFAAAVLTLPLLIWAFIFHVRRNRTHYILTNRNLTVEVGILAKQSTHIPLAKVQDVTVRRSFGDRLLGIGSIVVESAGAAGRIPEINVDSPVEVSRRILKEVAARVEQSSPARTGE